MKSYFAKLAARVTLANPQVWLPLSAPQPRDSFSETLGFATPAATQRVDRSVSLEHSSEGAASRPILMNTENTGRQKTAHLENERSPEDRSESVISRTESSNIEPRLRDTTPKAPEIQSLHPRTVLRDSYRTQRDKPYTGPTQKTEVPLTKSPVASNETEKIEVTPDESTEEHPRQTRSEQFLLLRKADDFMEALFAPRSVVAPDKEDTNRETESPKPEPAVKRESPVRLQPLSRPPHVPEPVQDEPSLVIEKLTVEVVPPPTQPLKSQRQVVIVREAGNGRRAVPSSQRFGLNHF